MVLVRTASGMYLLYSPTQLVLWAPLACKAYCVGGASRRERGTARHSHLRSTAQSTFLCQWGLCL